MKVDIYVFRQEDLLEEDASLSLGWLSFKDKGVEISLFREGMCMIFITLTSLLEAIKKLEDKGEKKIKWVGEDNGAVIQFFLEKDNLWMSIGDFSFILRFKDFKKEIVDAIYKFKNDCVSKNESIAKESAFKDLDLIIKKFI